MSEDETLVPKDSKKKLLSRSLHNEVLAQRVLDRKLTLELNKFRGKMASLTE